MDQKMVQVVQNRPSIDDGRLEVCAKSAPESPLVQKRGSQAKGSPCCAKMDQKMVQVVQNPPKNGPKNKKWSRTPIVYTTPKRRGFN